jgi:hypothetical protein
MDKECFVISPIGEDGSDIRKHSDHVLKHIIHAALSQNGKEYTVLRADEIPESGIITKQVIEHLRDAEVVIADLSFGNPNVFYEMAVRHLLQKPIVHLIKRGEKIPFDLFASRMIDFDLSDLDSIEFAKKRLCDQFSHFESGNNSVDNPISVAINWEAIAQKGTPVQKSVAEFVESLSEGLTARISQMESRIEHRLIENFERNMHYFTKISSENKTSSKEYRHSTVEELFTELENLKKMVDDNFLSSGEALVIKQNILSNIRRLTGSNAAS